MRRHVLSASLLAAILPGSCASDADLFGRLATLSGVDAVTPSVGKLFLDNPLLMKDADPPPPPPQDPPIGSGGGET